MSLARKTVILPILAAVVGALANVCGSTAKASVHKDHEQDALATIRQRYSTINKDQARYRTVKRDLLGFSTEGGELIAYFDGPAIRKIVASYYGETGRSSEEFYYWDGELQFVFQTTDTYSERMSGKVVKSKESRYYFNNCTLIKFLEGRGKQLPPGSREFVERQAHLLDRSKRFLAGLKRSEPIISAVK